MNLTQPIAIFVGLAPSLETMGTCPGNDDDLGTEEYFNSELPS